MCCRTDSRPKADVAQGTDHALLDQCAWTFVIVYLLTLNDINVLTLNDINVLTHNDINVLTLNDIKCVNPQ